MIHGYIDLFKPKKEHYLTNLLQHPLFGSPDGMTAMTAIETRKNPNRDIVTTIQ